MRRLAHRIVHARMFDYFLAVLIVGTFILHGVATSDVMVERFEVLIALFVLLMLFVLVLEVLLKLLAVAPRVDRYFREPWNVFDFLVITSIIGGIAVFEFAADFAILVVVVRLLRLLQGLTTIKALRLILTTMFRSIPDMVHILILLCIVVYLYGIYGHSFLKEHDPEHWGTLGKAVLSLFQVVTLDGWSEIMQTALEAEPLAWVYFVSFVIVTTFIGANLFIAVVVSTMDEAKQERLQTLEVPASREELLRELRTTQQSLRRVEEACSAHPSRQWAFREILVKFHSHIGELCETPSS